jgi:NDP-sugar pyrophosphorylase family protein
MQSPHDTPVVILAAGSSSRFFPLTNESHKGTVVLFGKPIIVRTLEKIEKAGFNKAIIVVSSNDMDGKGMSEIISQWPTNIEIIYSRYDNPKGMGDALLSIRDLLPERFAVVFPTVTPIDTIIPEMITHGDQEVLGSSDIEETWLYGILRLDETGRAVEIVEKPPRGEEPSNQKVYGYYVLTQRFLQILSQFPVEEYNFEAALSRLMEQSPVEIAKVPRQRDSLKYPWHLFDFQEMLFDELESYRSPSATIATTAVIDETNGPVFIEDGVTVGHAARIVGPCYLGKNVLVGDFSLIRESSMEADSVAGAYSELVRSIILEDSTYHSGYIADSIIGKHVRIGGGIMTANKRLDRAEVRTMVKGQMVGMGRNTAGVVIGDGAKLGVRVVTMPGVLIGSEAEIYPSVQVLRNVVANGTVE